MAPTIQLNNCVKNGGPSNFSATVQMETGAGKGCDRETFEASGMFAICGAGNVVDLLPRPGLDREWTKDLKHDGGGEL